MESCTVGDILLIDDSKEIEINNIGISDATLYNILQTMTGEDQKNFIKRSIKIGFEVLQIMDKTSRVDHIRNEFEQMKKEFKQELENTFFHNVTLSQKMEQYFGERGEVTQLFKQHLGEENSTICNILNHTDEETPLGKFRKELQHTLDVDRQGTAFNQLKTCVETGLQNILTQIEKRDEVEEAKQTERLKGTLKGRDFQEYLTETINLQAANFDDSVIFVGDSKGFINKTGDVLITINPKETQGKTRSIIIEAKQTNINLTGKNSFINELDQALENRSADYAIGAIHEKHTPQAIGFFRRYSDDKILCSIPEDSYPYSLEIAYKVARAEIINKTHTDVTKINTAKILTKTEDIKNKLDALRSTKTALTGAKTNIDGAYTNIETMEQEIRNCRTELTELLKTPTK